MAEAERHRVPGQRRCRQQRGGHRQAVRGRLGELLPGAVPAARGGVRGRRRDPAPGTPAGAGPGASDGDLHHGHVRHRPRRRQPARAGVPAMTAHHCVLADGPVNGQTVLVAGGAGAVGHFAIELAKRAGARVIATVSSPDKAVLAEKAGADLVVNYRSPGAVEQVRAFGPVDRVIEVALGANFELDLAVARPHATIVTYAAEPANPVLPVRACMTANVTLEFVLLYGVPMESLDQAAADISAALASGEL